MAIELKGKSARGASDDQTSNPENAMAMIAMLMSNPRVSVIARRAACFGVMRIFPSEMPSEYNSAAVVRPR